jgi:type IV pilus assembly protein PilW
MKSARGFSVVELMIALTLGLVVTGAVIATFVGMHSASGTTSSESVVADNGRIALDIIQQALRGAGYMACSNTRYQTSVLPVNPTSTMAWDFTEALSGYEAVGTSPGQTYILSESPPGDGNSGDWVSTTALGNALDPSFSALGALPIKGSDALAVHTTYAQVQPLYTTALSGPTSTAVATTAGLQTQEIAIVSDCQTSVVDQINGLGAAVQYQYSLPTFEAGSQVAVADTVAFYIGVGADGDGALFSYELAPNANFSAANTPAVEVVPDIENLQILYGVDPTGTLTATAYVTADQVVAMVQNNPNCQPPGGIGPVTQAFNCVVSVKVAILAASPTGAVPLAAQPRSFDLLGTTVTAPLDTRVRQSFDMTVQLRNLTD